MQTANVLSIFQHGNFAHGEHRPRRPPAKAFHWKTGDRNLYVNWASGASDCRRPRAHVNGRKSMRAESVTSEPPPKQKPRRDHRGRGEPLFASLRGKYLSINLFNLSIGRYRIYAEPYTAKKYFTYSPWNGRKSVLYYLCRRVRVIGRSRVLAHLKRKFLRVPALLNPAVFLFSQRTPNPWNPKS